MKRWIHCTTEVDQPGFLFEVGNRAIFLKSNQTYLTTKLIRDIINTVCDLRNIDDTRRKAALYHQPTLDDFRKRIAKVTLRHVETDEVEYYSIQGKNFNLNFPADEFNERVVVVQSRE